MSQRFSSAFVSLWTFVCSLQKYLKEWKSRKRNFKDLQDEICEGTDKNPQEFREIVGIETDEDFKVVQIEIALECCFKIIFSILKKLGAQTPLTLNQVNINAIESLLPQKRRKALR